MLNTESEYLYPKFKPKTGLETRPTPFIRLKEGEDEAVMDEDPTTLR
jgi:hypothetical protein